MKQFPYIFFAAVIMLLVSFSPARAGTKEELVRLQSDVLAMQNQLRVMEKAIADQNEALKSLIVQLNDQVGTSNQLISRMAATLENQSSGDKSSSQAALQELRSLNTKMDDAATRISALAQQISELKMQANPIETGGLGSVPGGAPDGLYNQAFNDLVQGNLDLAIEGFSTFIRNNPASEKADDAQYNVGEAYYNSNRFPQAVAAFTRVLNDYPEGDKVASSLFKRGKAEIAMKERDNAIQDFRTVLAKFPTSAEAALARLELEKLGADVKPQSRPTRRGR
jgi:tol-pal system protein YbgF